VDFQLNLNSETVEHAFLFEPLCLSPETTVREALRQMSAGSRGASLVCRDGKLVGIFTERDALKMMAQGANFDVPLLEVMTRNPVVLSRLDSVGSAIAKMSRGGYRRLPIVDDDGRPLGLLKIEGILHYLVEHFPAVVYNLPPEPHHTTHSREGA
jgi:CBS domain-containing protein